MVGYFSSILFLSVPVLADAYVCVFFGLRVCVCVCVAVCTNSVLFIFVMCLYYSTYCEMCMCYK